MQIQEIEFIHSADWLGACVCVWSIKYIKSWNIIFREDKWNIRWRIGYVSAETNWWMTTIKFLRQPLWKIVWLSRIWQHESAIMCSLETSRSLIMLLQSSMNISCMISITFPCFVTLDPNFVIILFISHNIRESDWGAYYFYWAMPL